MANATIPLLCIRSSGLIVVPMGKTRCVLTQGLLTEPSIEFGNGTFLLASTFTVSEASQLSLVGVSSSATRLGCAGCQGDQLQTCITFLGTRIAQAFDDDDDDDDDDDGNGNSGLDCQCQCPTLFNVSGSLELSDLAIVGSVNNATAKGQAIQIHPQGSLKASNCLFQDNIAVSESTLTILSWFSWLLFSD